MSDGAYPNSVIANGGNLYVAASFPISGAYGVISELSPKNSGWTESPLFVFSNALGGSDPTSLLMDASGNIFGSALYGGDVNGQLSGDGAVFELSPASGRRSGSGIRTGWPVRRRSELLRAGNQQVPRVDRTATSD